ncbi:MAG: glycoside hydrolase family 2 TIM barrel-domain containing protein [Rhizomicrobium sp.]
MKFIESRRGRALVFSVVAALGLLAQPAAGEARTTVDLQHGWRFKQAEGLAGVEAARFNDATWSKISLPHTWNRIGNAGTERSPESNSVQGTGWYRLRFKAPASAHGRRAFLQFDGVGAVADVWLNGRYLGKHEGAFARFRFDVTAAIRPSQTNLLVVKSDNSRPQPGSTTANVLPLAGDFFVFGGLYRNVSLVVTDPVHVDMMDFGSPGVYAHAASIDADAATVEVVERLVNDGAPRKDVRVETTIEDAGGKVVASSAAPADLTKRAFTGKASLRVAHPHLWQGVEDPYLYRVVLTLRAGNGAVLDRVMQPLGLRTMRFDPDTGFFLNGRHVLLKGAARHQDRPVKGWAISHADQDEDYALLSDMGANAVRLPHYQYDQYAVDLADAKGFVVWPEIPLVSEASFDGLPPASALTANARLQLTELIRQNYNHPSIALWSIANEVDLKPIKRNGPSKVAGLLRELNDLAHREDPTRPTTLADCCEQSGSPERDVITGLTDTLGYNRYFGWYYGKPADLGALLDRAHLAHPHSPLAVSEYGAGAALTQHTDDPTGGPINPHGRPHPEEMQNWYHEKSWDELKDRAYVWGVFIWNMFDFSSDERQEGDLTDINEKGLVSYDRKIRKDAFYFYRALWNPRPTLHLVGRRYVDRPYGVIDVKAYSNAKAAHLWLNGADIGVAPCAGGICLWPAVHLVPGANTVLAKADVGGETLSDTLQWTYAGTPAVVRIKAGDVTGYVAKDGSRYGSDLYFDGGEGRGINPPDTAAKDRIAATAADPPLYDSFREGDFSYRIPVRGGRYRIVARFVEPSADAAEQRAFDVIVNGKTVLSGFDVFAAAGGRLKGVDRTFDATAVDGRIELRFRPLRGKAIVSALAVTGAP